MLINSSLSSSNVGNFAVAKSGTPLTGKIPKEEEGATYDKTLDEGTVVTLGAAEKSKSEEEEFDYRRALYHVEIPIQEATRSLSTIETELKKIDKKIETQKPEIAKTSWDITVKDGKLSVVGNLKEEDAKWLEGQLNSSDKLTSAVEKYTKSAVDFLETSDENPAYVGINRLGGMQSYNFSDVKGQLDGSIKIKSLLNGVKNMTSSNGPNKSSGLDGNSGMLSLDLIASRLVPTAYV